MAKTFALPAPTLSRKPAGCHCCRGPIPRKSDHYTSHYRRCCSVECAETVNAELEKDTPAVRATYTKIEF